MELDTITWWHVNYESDYVALYRCSRCAALVIHEDKQHHEDWHSFINEGK